MLAKQMMTTDLITVTESATMQEVIQLMIEKNISGIPIVDEQHKLKGIVSESDIIRLRRNLHMPDYIQLLETMLNNAYPEDFENEITHALHKPVKEFMTKKVITVTEDTSLAEITRMMVEFGINRLPVVRGSRVIGIITRRDAIRTIAALQK